MENENAKLMLQEYDETALREIATAARDHAKRLRSRHGEERFAYDDARRFDSLADAIGALWPRIDG